MAFSFRAFISLALALSFSALIASGVVLYFAPPCGVAERAGWTFLGILKEGWTLMHMTTGLAFVVLGLFHLFQFNLRAFLSYLRNRRRSTGASRRLELWLAIAVVGLLVLGSALRWPPLQWLGTTQDTLKEQQRQTLQPERGGGQGWGGGSQRQPD